ncbi:MAG: pirin family protein [Myxococcales bacterium]|nr:pirin family protein [Myxococcales bacterium]
MLWLPGCHGKDARRPDPAPRPAVPSRGSEAPVLQRIEARPTVDGAGATVQRVFPGPELRHLDPFVLLDDFDVRVPAGFPEHPHRGFEAFTYMLEGAFHHRDTMGNDSTIAAGGTQRFNSGRGARHSEMPATGGQNRGLQLWVNLPRAKKAMEPEYQGVPTAAMPVDERDHQRIHTVIGPSSPVELHTEVEYLDVTLLADGRFERVIPPGYSTLLYVLEGSVGLGAIEIARGQGVVLGAGELSVRGREGARLAQLRGRPHHEPIVHRGPFVD